VPNYPDIETLLCDWLASKLPTGPDALFRRWVPEVPGDMFASSTGTPCVVIERYGGSDDIPGLDVARVSIDVYCAGPDPLLSRAAAKARGEDIRRVISLSIVGQTLGLGGPVVSHRRILQAPTIRPYDSRAAIRRSQGSYEIRLHSTLSHA